MAIGDQDDFLSRLKGTLPSTWFGSSSPILDAVLSAFAWCASFAYSLIQYVKLQTRLATATDDFLDMISADFFGTALPRNTNESDTQFRARILIYLFRERGTRNAIISILKALTGRTPKIFEAWNPSDTGGYNIGGVGYGVGGAYGSLLLNQQVFVTAYRQASTGIPNIAGYGISTGGYNQPSEASYVSLSQLEGNITDAEIYAAIENVRPVGANIWVAISN